MTLARVYREIGLSSRAEEVYRDLLERRPNLDTVYLELAALHQRQGEGAKAVAVLREALTQNPESTPIRLRLVRLLVASRNFSQALQELDPNDINVVIHLANTYIAANQ